MTHYLLCKEPLYQILARGRRLQLYHELRHCYLQAPNMINHSRDDRLISHSSASSNLLVVEARVSLRYVRDSGCHPVASLRWRRHVNGLGR